MKNPYALRSVPIILAAIFCLAGCASQPAALEPAPAESSVQVRLVDQNSLKARFGSIDDENPYIPHRTLFLGAREEFIAFEVDVDAAVDGPISVRAEALDPDGKSVAVLRDLGYMQHYWEAYNDGRSDSICLRKLGKSYMKSNPLKAKAGRQSFMVLLVGNNPIPRPSSISMEIDVPGMNLSKFSFDLLK